MESTRSKQIAVAILASLSMVAVDRDYDPFMQIAEIINPEFDGRYDTLLPFEKALMMLAEDYFDAEWHGFEEVGKIPIVEARALLQTTSIAILKNRPVDEQAVRAPFSAR